jgi:two-component system LytT family response regulator
MKYKAIIIDDERNARILLEGMIKDNFNKIEVVDSCQNLADGVKSIVKNKPELVFLDIEMPQHSGLEILDFFEEKDINFSIIFTTAYHEYAINAFKLSAIDYLLKPINPNALDMAIERFEKKQIKSNLNLLKANLNPENVHHQKLAIHTTSSIRYIETNDIMYIKGDGSYAHFFLKDGSQIMVSKTLKHYEDALNQFTNFFRCHRSYLVNIHYITEFIKTDGGYVVINNEHQLSVSQEKTNELIKVLRAIQ